MNKENAILYEKNSNYDYIVVDFNNMFYRNRYVVKYGSMENRLSLVVHIIFSSLGKLWKLFGPARFVICCDSKSWRNEVFEDYRLMRKVNRLKNKNQEEDEKFFELYNNLVDFFDKQTNFILLKKELLEADDFISIWTRRFDNNNNLIVSTDSDFIQLINQKVSLFNYDKDRIIKYNGVYDTDGNIYSFSISRYGKLQIKNKGSIKDLPEKDWTEWSLFCKAVCGDVSDGILPIAPRLNLKKVKEAFDDRKNKSYHWNNFMMSVYEEDGRKIKYIDKYNKNMMLVNLRELPEEIEILGNEEIDNKLKKPIKKNQQVYFSFMKFCGLYFLEEVAKKDDLFVKILSYSGKNEE